MGGTTTCTTGQSPEAIGRAAVGAMIDAKLVSPAARDRLDYGYARDVAGRATGPDLASRSAGLG